VSKNAKQKLKAYLQAQQERDKVSAAKWHEHVQDLIEKANQLKLYEPKGYFSLDNIVHDLKSSEASAINNEGAKAQIDYIIERLGPEQGVAKIEEALS
jgi:hypothetical protein